MGRKGWLKEEGGPEKLVEEEEEKTVHDGACEDDNRDGLLGSLIRSVPRSDRESAFARKRTRRRFDGRSALRQRGSAKRKRFLSEAPTRCAGEKGSRR